MRVKFNLFIGLCLLSFVNISAQYTSIPDSNFEAALITLGHDNVSDGLVLTSNISSLTSLDLSSAGISDLTGIEDFTALTDLDLDSNTLTSLDVSANSNLQHLNFDNNSIATINLGTNTVLHTVYGRYNQLSAIDVTQNTGLTLLNLRDNLFTAIDVSNNVLLETLNIRECSNVSDIEVTNNTNLKFLYLQDVGVTSLDISQNTLLEVITLERNSLTTLDVSNNILLRQLRVSDNDLTILDASNNSALTRLSCQNNDLTFLNIQNGNNAAIGTTDFDATGNTSLRCIKVDDPTWSTTNWTNVDAGITFFSTGYCRYTAIPDANFELALDGLGYDDNSEDGQVPTALIEVVTELLVGAEGISDLTGIEDFAALERLQCHNNSIQTLDLRSNTLLEYIKCDDNNMDLLNLEGLQYFEEIIGFGNDFTSFDFTNNPKLSKISLFNNDITDLDLSNNPELVFVRLDQNELTSLDIQNGSNTIITTFNTNSNPNLTCIKVDDVDYSDANWTDINTTTSFTETNYCYTAIPDANFEAKLEDLGYDDISGDGKVPTALIERVTSLNVSSQSISDLTGIEDFTALTSLVVLSNNLTSIDVSSNTLLTSLNVSRNDLTAIDITNNTALTSFSAFETDIASINFTYNTLLESIDLNRVSTLTAIDVSTLSNLEDLILYRTGITSIDVTNNLKLEELRLDYTDVTSLDVSKNTLLTNLKTNASLITDLDLTLNFALTRLEAFDGELESLDIRNGSNTAITFFDIKNNPSLECVFVDDAEYSDTNWENIGSTTVFRDTNYCHYTAIPDTIFEAKLYDLGYDDVAVDGQVPTELIASVTSLNVNDLGIDELTGIEDFIDLKTLNCRGNDLTTIDLSQNTLLEILAVNNNDLTTIDLSQNIALTSVNLGANDFTTIDVSMLSALEKLYVQVNTELTSIAVGSNTFLEDLSTTSTNIASLDLSNNINLEKLEAYNSALTAIDLSNNIELTTLRLDGTNITELDLSNNTKVTSLRVNDTAIEILDLSKQTSLQGLHAYDTNLKSLNIRNGNNANVGTFRAEDNPNLSCILVDDVDYSTTYWTDIPSGLFFSETYCIYTAIPDANFEAALDDLDLDDITGDGKVPTPLIEVVEDLTIVGKSISDISGIENFTALKTLNCASNNFTSLNLSNNTALTSVITKFTPLTTLEVGSCTSLETLVCSFNDLSGLYVANNASLTYLECNNNNLTSLDVSSNTALLDLRCGDNSLTTLDVSNNTALTSIWCQDNAITALDFTDQPNLVSIIVNDNSLTDFDVRNGNNTNVTNFVAIENASLTCVHVDSATYSTNNWLGIDDTASFTDTDYCRYTAIPDAKFEARLESLGLDDVSGDGQVPTALIEGVTYLIADNKGITDLTGIEDFVALETLRCRNNNGLIAVDLSENTQLKWVYLSKNSLSTIDLSNCLALTTLDVGGNDLLAVDLSDNTSLENLDVAGNDFTTLDVTQNVNLDYLVLDNLNITSIDLSQNTLLEEIYFSYTALTSIDFSNNTALYYVECEESNQLASLDFSNNIILEELYLYDNASLTSLNVKNGANDIISDFEVEGSPNLNCILVDNATYSAANWIYIDDQMSFKEVSCSEYVQVAIDVYLQGAFINPNLGEESLMRDDLRVASGTYGLTSPYSDSATISDAIQLDDADSDTMVDWIWVELRTADNPNSVIAGKSGILQRDGDIVEVSEDRITPLFFEVSPDAYYIVIKHRNHLSIMTSSPVSLSATTTVVDLVSNSSNIAGGSNAVADMGNGIFAMIAGDYDENGQIQNTDISAVIQELGVSGYNKADLDMNGQVQNSDINSLLNPNLGKGEQLINSVD